MSSFEKRIKRHVSGCTHDFFAVTNPGLENLCRMELTRLPFCQGEAETVSGGVNFRGKLYDAYGANLHLRTASRILMRLASLSATQFHSLSKKAAEIPWELFLPAGSAPKVFVAVHHCRLYHKAAISEIFADAVRIRLSGVNGNPPSLDTGAISQRLFIRGLDDRFGVSMDTSGDLLYKRGLKTRGGAAPLRETLAAAILMLAGYSGTEPLLNPMCGSGTFAVEAALMARRIPAGWFRSFAFMEWPAFRPSQWAHLRDAAEKYFVSGPIPPVVAIDTAKTACDALRALAESHPALDGVDVREGDFLDLPPQKYEGGSGLVVLNPPYGKRMGSREDSRRLIREVIRKLKADYGGWRFAMIVPERSDAGSISRNWGFYRIYHGGLALELLIGNI